MKYQNGIWLYKGMKGYSISDTFYQYINWQRAQRFHAERQILQGMNSGRLDSEDYQIAY